MKLKILVLNFDKPMELIDLDTVADITGDLEFKPKVGETIRNKLSFEDYFSYKEYFKLEVLKTKHSGLFDIKLIVKNQLFNRLNPYEKPFRVEKIYHYNGIAR